MTKKTKTKPKPHNPIGQVTFCDTFTQAEFELLCEIYDIDPNERGAFPTVMTKMKDEKLADVK